LRAEHLLPEGVGHLGLPQVFACDGDQSCGGVGIYVALCLGVFFGAQILGFFGVDERDFFDEKAKKIIAIFTDFRSTT